MLLKDVLIVEESAASVGRLAREVEVATNRLTRHWCRILASEGVIIEGIAGLFQLVSQAIIRLFEIQDDACILLTTRMQAGKRIV